MKLLLFDTETTGLPKSREPATHGPNNWPHLVSIAWIVLEDDKTLKEQYHIINPSSQTKSWTIPPDSTAIHGITQEKAEAEGKSLNEVIQEFLNEDYDIMVAHNMEFDFNVLVNAILWDLGLPYPKFKQLFCSMNAMKHVCKLPSKFGKGYKPPKLSELYEFVVRISPRKSELHNSLYDTQLLKEIILRSTVLRPMLGLPAVGLQHVGMLKTNESKTNILTI